VTLSDNLDVPALLKMLILEAKRTGVRVERVEPGLRSQKKYYLEQEFKMNVTGTFAQVVHYFQRIAQLQRILRVEEFSMKPATVTNLSGNVLDSKLSIRAYQYTVSSEDQVAKGVKK
jgi:Tfp pilus assembly protein PilO